MSRLRHRLLDTAIAGIVPIDTRRALVVERLIGGKFAIWRCSRKPDGQPALSSASSVWSAPVAAVPALVGVLLGLATGGAPMLEQAVPRRMGAPHDLVESERALTGNLVGMLKGGRP